MNAGRGGPPQRVPTLTEVIELTDEATAPAGEVEEAVPPADLAADADGALPNADRLTERVLEDVQRQIGLMLEYRLREVLTPLLARSADALIRDARKELASSLREIVERAVAQELSRHRDGPGAS